ncbi:MAG: TIGR00730 family Rossman fold protein [Chthoniobacterales bacterium]|nr:TIGR00730 family Rossman fold protein [Chthoniobacterales bacterium]
MSKREGTPSVPPHQHRAENTAEEAENRRPQPVDDVADSTATEEQSQETAEAPHPVPSSELRRAHELADELVAELAKVDEGDIVGEVVINALKLLRDQTNRGDIKLINKSLKELRYALKIFAPYRDVRKVSIFGSARTLESHDDYKQAAVFGKQMAGAGWMVITGAGGGIMAAGHGGAGAEPSFGLAIRLPFEQATNPFIANDPKLINFKYFFTRKLMFVRSSHAIALFPGGFGTMDEGFEVLTLVQTGKCVPMPIVFVDRPGGDFWASWQEYVKNHLLASKLISPEDLHLYKMTDNIETAVQEVTKFYRNFHSVRYTRDEIVLRLQHKPTEEQLDVINTRFADIKPRGAFRATGPLPVERDEPTLNNLHRLAFPFNRRDHGKLRMLIDYLNDPPARG